ncbi:hypothetical protein SFOMI_0975 [Sphingobium fuliginis]|uniref:Uncharacterized protein n=1 Tax=Sphingobium fuliginis (strain ATCC 27551) TaxID=336203 RepID=A0A292ZC39_SPHSA|nr:hypothetical protein SFOMI_0975 [Sphingobium fuliginis]
MGLAAAERGLELNDWLTALAGKALGNLREKHRHTFGDEGALVERDGILVFAAGLA